MKFKIYSHRFAENIVKDDLGFKDDYEELINVIEHIKDFDLEDRFKLEKQKRPNTKSLSTAINGLIRERLESCGWNSESAIFKEAEYIKGNTSYWRLDFAKNNIAIFFDDIVSKTSDGYDFIAQVVNVNLETGFTFLDGPVQGRKGEIEFDAGHVEIHERGNKIFISSGVKLIIPSSFMKQIGKE